MDVDGRVVRLDSFSKVWCISLLQVVTEFKANYALSHKPRKTSNKLFDCLHLANI